jgi:hypothetical protein
MPYHPSNIFILLILLLLPLHLPQPNQRLKPPRRDAHRAALLNRSNLQRKHSSFHQHRHERITPKPNNLTRGIKKRVKSSHKTRIT